MRYILKSAWILQSSLHSETMQGQRAADAASHHWGVVGEVGLLCSAPSLVIDAGNLLELLRTPGAPASALAMYAECLRDQLRLGELRRIILTRREYNYADVLTKEVGKSSVSQAKIQKVYEEGKIIICPISLLQ